jgi:hypothetical protein
MESNQQASKNDSKARVAFLFHWDWLERCIDNLNGDEIKAFITAVILYDKSNHEQTPLFKNSDGNVNRTLKIAFDSVKVDLDNDRARYDKKCQQNTKNIKDYWNKTKTK